MEMPPGTFQQLQALQHDERNSDTTTEYGDNSGRLRGMLAPQLNVATIRNIDFIQFKTKEDR
jgi:hypothetical protein